MSQLTVAIWMVTYNHEAYIEQAIMSVMMQKTSFSFKLFIGEDCSKDNTRAICLDLKENYPDKIQLFLHDTNMGSYANGIFMYEQCFKSDAKYIALLEGDDYWIDPLKLQKQVGFLETHLEYELCFTNIRIIDSAGNVTKEQLIKDRLKTTHEAKDLPLWAPTLTRVFRNRDFSSLPSAPGFDTFMLLWQSQFGKLKLINEIMGVYRKHDGGIYSAQSEAKRKEQIIVTDIACLDLIDGTLFTKYFGMLFKKLVELYYLDVSLFKTNKVIVRRAYQNFKFKMSFLLRFKIEVSFMLISLPLIKSLKNTKPLFLKVFNHLFSFKP